MITLASDFGTPYPAAMKGVLLDRCDARLVDVAHDFPRQDVRATAFWLREVLPWFPPATHLVVVDPGVGTDRRAIAAEAGGHRFVAPDNGVVLPVLRAMADGAGSDREGGDGSRDPTGHSDPTGSGAGGEAGDGGFAVYEVPYDDDATPSNTFHGRDVFAPAAAAVYEADAVGAVAGYERVEDWVDCALPEPALGAERAVGEVLVVDGFGNVVTNLPGELVADRETVTVNGERVGVHRSYAAVAPGERLVTVASHGNVELAVNRGRGDEAFGLAADDRVVLE